MVVLWWVFILDSRHTHILVIAQGEWNAANRQILPHLLASQ